jgi:hypothetical protein
VREAERVVVSRTTGIFICTSTIFQRPASNRHPGALSTASYPLTPGKREEDNRHRVT